MPGPRYSIDQLKKLRASPLCKAPPNVPSIEKWIDPPAEGQRRPKTQNGKVDENDHPSNTKRASPLDSRHNTRHSKDGEDIFLGPKMSFAASASAARYVPKAQALDERQSPSVPDDIKQRHDRFVNIRDKDRDRDRERALRDGTEGREKTFERQKPRADIGHQNGLGATNDQVTAEGRMRSKFEDWKIKNRERIEKDGDSAETGDPGSRKTPFGRGSKFDRPWFKENNQETRENPDGQLENRPEKGSWRDRERRIDGEWNRSAKLEQDPRWMKETEGGDFALHTQDDFQKWKEKMKAEDKSSSLSEKEKPLVGDQALVSIASVPLAKTTGTEENFFGTWGEASISKKPDETKVDGDSAAAKPAVKAKSSRFAGFFGAAKTDQPGTVAQPAPVPSPPPPPRSPEKATTTADQEGFERMMQMLRMGAGSASQASQKSQPFDLPSSSSYSQHVDTPDDFREADPRSGEDQTPTQFHTAQPPAKQQQLQAQPSQNARHSQVQSPPLLGLEGNSRPQTIDRNNSEFLLNLMQQQRQQQQLRISSQESQAYRQNYNRSNEPESSHGYDLNHTHVHLRAQEDGNQKPQQRGPPPGFFANEHAFSTNRGMDSGNSGVAAGLAGPDQDSNHARARPSNMMTHSAYDLTPYHPNQEASLPQLASLQTGQPSGQPPQNLHSNFEQHQQPQQHWPNGRPPSSIVSPHDGIPPPPGFPPAGGRGPALPGFFSFPPPPPPPLSSPPQGRDSHNSNPQQPPSHNPNLPPGASMRGQMPPPLPGGSHHLPQHQQMPPPHLHGPPPGNFFNGPRPSPVGPQGPPGFLPHFAHHPQLHPQGGPLGPPPAPQQQGQQVHRRPPSGPPGFFSMPGGNGLPHQMQYMQHMPSSAGK